MEWYASIVTVRVGSHVGSGVLLQEDTVLTAAHVLDPLGNGAPAAQGIVVEVPWASYAKPQIVGVRVHPEWSPANLVADFAAIRVDAVAGLGLPFGAPDVGDEAFLYGYPAAASASATPPSSYQSGFLQRDTLKLYSDSFHVASGMSGSPFVQISNGVTRVVGLATWDSNAPAAGAFKGLPVDSSSFVTFWPPVF
jgi:hypothetical protein